MKNLVLATAVGLCLVSLPVSASADMLVMKDGTRVQGTVVGIASRTITFRTTDGVSRRYMANQVESLQFFTAEPMRGRGNGNGNGNRNAYGRDRSDRNSSNNDSSYGILQAPAGTEIVVRTVELIDSRTAEVDQTFATLVEADVVDGNGRVIIGERSSAQLIIRQVSSGGASGSAEMVLDLQSITVDGRRYRISTTDLTRSNDTGIGANKRTAEAVGGGATLGTIIGAIAGGGKGAAIGGLIGAAGGAGAQVVTRGHDVRVPAETVLRFKLDRAVTLQAAR